MAGYSKQHSSALSYSGSQVDPRADTETAGVYDSLIGRGFTGEGNGGDEGENV